MPQGGPSVLGQGPVLGLNHVLAQQSWARQRLIPYAGQVLEVHLPPLPDLRLTIQPDGLLAVAPAGPAPELRIDIQPATVPLILLRDPAMNRGISFTGSADLAQAVQQLFRELEWDFEEDLSKVFGDVFAHRLASAGRAFFSWQRDAGLRLAQNASEYWTEEKPMIARRDDLVRFSNDVNALRDDVERLEKRLERVAQPAQH